MRLVCQAPEGGFFREADSSSEWESGKNLLRTRAIYPTSGGLPSSPYGSTLGCV